MFGSSPIKWRQRPDLTIAVHWDDKPQIEQTLNASGLQFILNGSVTHSRVEAPRCYKLVRVISRRLSRELPRVMLKTFKSCRTR